LNRQQKVQFVLPKSPTVTPSDCSNRFFYRFKSAGAALLAEWTQPIACSNVRTAIGPGDDDLLNAPSEGRSRRLITLSRSSPRRIERPDRELAPRQRPSFISVHG
jgi:hypothetical protein